MRITVRHLTADYLRELLHYDPLTGIFTWKVNKGRRANIGDVAGCVGGRGYVLIKIDGVKYTAGRLAYLYMQGEPVPDHIEIDHHNEIRSDNRWDNLSPLTHAENVAKHHKIVRDAKLALRRRSLPRWKVRPPQSDDPMENIRQFLADNADAIELTQLLAEQERRKKVRRKRTRVVRQQAQSES